MIIREVCLRGKSSQSKHNGHMHKSTQHHHGPAGGRQCVQGCAPYLSTAEKRARIARLLVERIAWRGLCREAGGTRKGVWGLLVQGCEALPEHLHVQPVNCIHNVMIQRLDVDAEARASLVPKKAHQ